METINWRSREAMSRCECKVIYTRPLLDYLESQGVRVKKVLAGLSVNHFSYPDGSLEFEAREDYKEFENAGAVIFRDAVIDDTSCEVLWAGVNFRSLLHHRDVLTGIYLFGPWIRNLRDRALVVATQRFVNPQKGYNPREGDSASLTVTVKFVRKASYKVKLEFSRRLFAFFGEDGEASIDGELSLKCLPTVRFAKSASQFTIDASQTGVRTVTWLLLHILSFNEVAVIEEISFLQDTVSFDGLSRKCSTCTWDDLLGPFDTVIECGDVP